MLHLNDHHPVLEDKPEVFPPTTSLPNTTIDFHSKTASSAALNVEANWILANVTVIDATKLLTASFGKVATDATKATSQTLSDCFRQAKGTMEWKLEAEMYRPLCMAFNKCCEGIKPNPEPGDYVPENPLQCVNIHNERYSPSPEVSFNTRIGPDLCLSFDSTADSWLPCDHPNVCIEVKESALTDLSSGTRDEPSRAQNELLVQLFDDVVYGQWPALPYRFCWSLSISGHLMRIWRWTASGVVVTEPIDYLEDATVVAQFIQLIASGPYSRLGLDVGLSMTFSSIANSDETTEMRDAMSVYTDALPKSTARTLWVERAEKCKVWRFRPTRSDGPSESQNLSYQLNGQRDADDYILVVSHPISWTLGIFSRGTRCYIAIYQSDAKKGLGIPIRDIHTLKLSWQYTTRTSELVFFNEVRLQSPNHHIPHLASVLCGGDIPHTTQKMGLFQKENHRTVEQPTINDEDLVKDCKPVALNPSGVVPSDPRVLRWILFKEVGASLSNVTNSKQMVQAICDAIEAHEALYLIGILHRDISEGNVLLDLSNDYRGLLIDMDMAMKLLKGAISNEQNKVIRPAITGTLRFLSIALASRPIHRNWHDLESFFWLLVYMTIKHAPEVTFARNPEVATPEAATPDSGRAEILQVIFPDNGTDRGAFNAMTDAKLLFLIKGRLKILPNHGALSTLIREFHRTFDAVHHTLQQVAFFQEDWADARQHVTLPDFDSFKTNPHSFETMADLHKFRVDCETALAALEVAVSSDEDGSISEAIDPTYLHNDGRQVINGINQLRHFPTYEYILDNLKKTLAKPSSKWAAQSAVVEYEPRRSVEKEVIPEELAF